MHAYTLALVGLLSAMHKLTLAELAVTVISPEAECMQKCGTVASVPLLALNM